MVGWPVPSSFSEMSSEAIYVAVHACLEQNGGRTAENLAKCGCAVDAVRLNTKRTGAKAPENNMTPAQAETCRKRLPATKGKVGG